MKVLVVDDDAAIRLIVSHVLRSRGHDVMQAADAAAALAALDESTADLVLMDVQLGLDDGIDLAGRLLAARRHPWHLVFLTGTNDPESMRRMEAAGPRGIIAKPFDPISLPALLEQLLA